MFVFVREPSASMFSLLEDLWRDSDAESLLELPEPDSTDPPEGKENEELTVVDPNNRLTTGTSD